MGKTRDAIETGIGWAWKIQDFTTGKWCLCNWAEPSNQRLRLHEPPSSEARAVRVRIVPSTDYLRLVETKGSGE